MTNFKKEVGENDKFHPPQQNETNSPTFSLRQQIHTLRILLSSTPEGVFGDESLD